MLVNIIIEFVVELLQTIFGTVVVILLLILLIKIGKYIHYKYE